MYLISDYDQSEFTIAPYVWPPTFTPDIKAILPPSANTTDSTVVTTVTHKRSTLYGAVAGGLCDLALLVGSLLLFYFLVYRRRRPKSTSTGCEVPQSEHQDSERTFDASESQTKYGAPKIELEGEQGGAEITRTPILGSELASPEPVGCELDCPQIYEMPAGEVVDNDTGSHYDWRTPIEEKCRDHFDKLE